MRTIDLLRVLPGLALLCAATATHQASAADLLTIGSEAPKLDVEHWVQDGGGKFKPVTEFETGKVYVVEFWATWCGPCIASMPHLAQLQKDYASKGVQIVSISDEDLETVEKFLEREVRGGKKPPKDSEEGEDAKEEKNTYRKLTSAYCLTTDPDQSSYKDYMTAAAQNGIPTAFIVGKDSHIEWIGHPMEMDGPLEAVVSDSWDREAYAEDMRARQEAEKAMQEIFALLEGEKFDDALTLIDENLAKGDNMQLSMLKLQVLLAAKKSDGAREHLNKLFTSIEDQPEITNMVAWNMYEMSASGQLEDKEILSASIAAAKAAIAKLEDRADKASTMDTLAHLLFVSGELDQALEVEREALKITTDRDRKFIEDFLKELEAAKEKGAAKADEKSAAAAVKSEK